MTNYGLIEKAVATVVDFFEVEGITETTNTITKRALDWYNKTEITDAKMLAAAVISGSYRFGTTWDELVELTNFYFPTTTIAETVQQIDEMLENEEVEQMEGYIEAHNISVDELYDNTWENYDDSYYEGWWD
jgi:hypothetical protein